MDARSGARLPFEHTSSFDNESAGGAVRVLQHTLPPHLLADLEAMSRARGRSLPAAVLAAWHVLLARLTEEDALILGVARPENAPQSRAGYAPVTCRLTKDASFSDMLEQAERALHAPSDTPAPLPFTFALHSQAAAENFNEEARSGAFVAECAAVQDALGDNNLRLVLRYNGARLDEAGAERLAACFEALLAGAARKPERPVLALPLMDEALRRTVMAEWNRTDAPTPDTTLHDLVARQVHRTPGSTALVCDEDRLTYADLWQRAGDVADALRARGVGPEACVGLCAERSVALIVGVLGILRAGAAYVPLDPDYPDERLRYMLEDSNAQVVVAQNGPAAQRLRSVADKTASRPDTVRVASSGAILEEEPSAPKPASSSEAQPGNLAYVIYTSGSTGRPKGVMIEHRSAVALLRWAESMYGPEDWAGVLASTSVCFDLSVFELFLPLTQGGTVILAENALHLPDLPAAEEVTLVNTVPSAMTALLRAGGLPPSVRTVNLAGEPLRAALVDQIYALGTVERVFDLYGPSEDTTYSTFALREPGGPEVIGRPIAGTEAYVLDEHGQPVPPGVPGECYLGGAGLARGYLGRPAMTKAAFVANPFSDRPGARLYRTGDRVRQHDDGTLEFIGRLDRQVKLRGYRIELGEVETALREHPSIKEAAVVVHGEAEAQRLVAYVVATSNADAEPPVWRAFLEETLPGYMVPAVFVELDALPLTLNGKINRKALPDPEASPPEPEASEAPRTPLEETLAGIWAEVLGVERVGRRDDFFDLGGHSLLAMRIVARMRERLAADVPLGALMQAPTVADMARLLSSKNGAPQASTDAPPAIPKRSNPDEAPLSVAQQRLWFLHRLQPDEPLYNEAAAVRLRGPLDRAALREALGAVVARHEVLRTRFESDQGTPRQIIDAPRPVMLRTADLRATAPGKRDEALHALLREEARRPFDLGEDLMLRALLVRLAGSSGEETEHALLLTAHHIAVDGWSLVILFRELTAFYEAARSGRLADLPNLPAQYADYAAHQRAHLDDGALADDLAYWKKQLRGPLPTLDVPTDHPRPLAQSHRGRRVWHDFAPDLRAPLDTLGRQEDATLFMTLLAAYAALLRHTAEQDDLLIGTNFAGREHPATEDLIGFFANLLVLRADASGNPTFRELIGRVRTVALAAYAHNSVPFDRLVEAVRPERDPSRTPLIQTVFSLERAHAQPLDQPPLATRPLDLDPGTAKFDLVMDVIETSNGRLRGSLEHNADVFDARTAKRLLARYEAVLRRVAEQPGIRLHDLSAHLTKLDEQHEAAAAEQRDTAKRRALQHIRRTPTRPSHS